MLPPVSGQEGGRQLRREERLQEAQDLGGSIRGNEPAQIERKIGKTGRYRDRYGEQRKAGT
ncbi:hypothetical protein ACTMU2_05175 [Cupriavidus basilensis]